MRVFLVNLIPTEVGERVRSRGESRRMGLLVALLLLSLIGVSIHSWDQARRARAVRDAAMISRERIDNLENDLGRLELERQHLASFMTTYRSVALPIEMSDLIATLVNRLPEKATLTDMTFKVESRTPAPGAASGPVGPGAPPLPALPAQRFLELRIRGFAASNSDITAFERTLAATPPLSRVTLGENRSMETPEGNFQEFVITAEVPLERAYTTSRDTRPLALDDTPLHREPVR